jgi:hypothetical protein
MHATGNFEVKVQSQAAANPQATASGLGRLSLDKQFHGDLDASGQGEMLAAGDGTSGAYVPWRKSAARCRAAAEVSCWRIVR